MLLYRKCQSHHQTIGPLIDVDEYHLCIYDEKYRAENTAVRYANVNDIDLSSFRYISDIGEPIFFDRNIVLSMYRFFRFIVSTILPFGCVQKSDMQEIRYSINFI